MSTPQPGILAPLPPLARYLEFAAVPDRDPLPALRGLAGAPAHRETVIGLGHGLIAGLGGAVAGLRPFAALSGPGCEVPATQADLWCWVRGTDRGDILHRGRAIADRLDPAFRPVRVVDGFKYRGGLDLTGYEDGTENPVDQAAVEAAIARDGGSFVAVQQWVHDLGHFESLPGGEQDSIFGRRRDDNEEIEDAPESAHVKRTAQESFEPEAFVVRRSMPWADADAAGLVFVAFGHSLDAFEAQMRRMAGLEDGIVDALFRFSRPISGSTFWCPPLAGDRLDLRALGL